MFPDGLWQAQFTYSYLTSRNADIFLEILRTVIIVADPIRALVAGLDTDSELVRTACTDALHGFSKHGLILYHVSDRKPH